MSVNDETKTNISARRKTQRDVQREATRMTVLDTAIGLFSERGFDGTTLPTVTARCGTPVPLIIYHFKSKDQLWREAVDEVYRRLETHMAGHADRIAAAEGYDFFRASIRAHISALAAHPEYMRILFQEGTRSSDRLSWLVKKHQNRITERITGLIASAQADGFLPQMDLIHAKFVLSGAFSFPIVLAAEYRLVDNVDPESEDFLERHIDLCMQLFMPQK